MGSGLFGIAGCIALRQGQCFRLRRQRQGGALCRRGLAFRLAVGNDGAVGLYDQRAHLFRRQAERRCSRLALIIRRKPACRFFFDIDRLLAAGDQFFLGVLLALRTRYPVIDLVFLVGDDLATGILRLDLGRFGIGADDRRFTALAGLAAAKGAPGNHAGANQKGNDQGANGKAEAPVRTG